MSCFQILGMGPGGPSSAATSFWGLDVPHHCPGHERLSKVSQVDVSYSLSYSPMIILEAVYNMQDERPDHQVIRLQTNLEAETHTRLLPCTQPS